METYPKIIAVDFDGCLVENKYPEIGNPIMKNIKKLKEEQDKGAKVILWTCRVDDYLKAALDFCDVYEIHLDAVNENLLVITNSFGRDTRKIFANEYWDDRAVLMSEKDIGEFSDGYHTFNDLYKQRRSLSIALFNTYRHQAWKSRKHSDGQPCFGGGWFIVGIDTPCGSYTYHYEDMYWNNFGCKALEVAPEWDGHTDKDVIRLETLSTYSFWISVEERLPEKPYYDWVLVKCLMQPEAWYGVPHIAELVNGVWQAQGLDSPLEETLSVKVTHWAPLPGDIINQEIILTRPLDSLNLLANAEKEFDRSNSLKEILKRAAETKANDIHTDFPMEGKVPNEDTPIVCCESKTAYQPSTFVDAIRHICRAFRLTFEAIKDIFTHKSNMQSWAEREIEIACKHERAGNETPDGDWDYGCACYESAFKAFKSLMGAGHSGFSIGYTKHILNRLIDGKPLTPIEDTPDVWNDISDMSGLKGEEVNYQCKRMSALFKYVYSDGTIKYTNIDSHYCVDINDDGNTYHSGLVQKIMDEMFPITMPYMPGKPIKVYCQDILTDKKNGDFDTVAVFYAVKPDGAKIEINRFFKESNSDYGWDEIPLEEYEQRKDLELKRIWEEKPCSDGE